MAIANNILFLALRNAGVTGVGQTPSSDDINDAFTILNAQIGQWSLERKVTVNPTTLPSFPDLTTNVTFWDPYVHLLLTTMAVRLRQVYALPPVELDVQMAMEAIKAFQALNQQQIAPLYELTQPGTSTTAEPIVFLALRMAGRLNDTQSVSPTSKDAQDAYDLLNTMIGEWNLERKVQANPITLPTFPDFSITTVPFWNPYQQILVTNLSVRIQQSYGAQPSPVDLQIAADNRKLLQALNQQQAAPVHPGVPATCGDIIFLALRMAGRVTDTQSVSDSSKDVDDAFKMLVGMVAQWQRKRWLIFTQGTANIVSTGAQSYSIGPGAGNDIVVPYRPDHITAAFARIIPGVPPNLVDIPLDIIYAEEDYMRISVKSLQSTPALLYYEAGWQTGQILVWPVPPANQYQIFISFKSPLPTYATVNDAINLPPEYQDALVSNLACRIAAASGLPIHPYVMAQATMGLNTLRQANTQIPRLELPAALTRWRGDISLVGPGLGRAFVTNQDVVLG